MSRTPLEQQLAHELEEARLLLEKMGDELATDIEVVTAHGVALQSVDIVGQIMGHIANVVRASNRVDAVRDIGMHDLKMKLIPAIREGDESCEEAA